jgi:hypothetical protein
VKTFAAISTIPLSAFAATLLLFPFPATPQGRGRGAAQPAASAPVVHHPVPRAADGKPDLTGTWQAGGVSITGEAGAPPVHPLPPIDQHPINRQPLAYKPEFEAKRKSLTTLDDPTLQCLLPGVPRIQTEPMPLEIVQTPKEIVILYESFRAWRRIPIDNNLKHPDDITPTWMGDSVGRWEGDTLVVDVTNQNPGTWFDMVANFHSDALHVIERFTMKDSRTIGYEATLDDSKVFTRPWKIAFNLVRSHASDYEQMEYACVEGEKDLQHYTTSEGGKKKP